MSHHPTPATFHGFTVRPVRDEDLPAIGAWFAESQLGSLTNCLVRGAFGQPGEVPLGAAVARVSSTDPRVGFFHVYVDPEARRRRIGTRLVHHLYELALANNAELLVLSELIHQDRPDNAFFRASGLTPQGTLGTYVLDGVTVLEKLCEPVVRRFARSHPHVRGAEIVGLDQLHPRDVVSFIETHYSGFADAQLERLTGKYYDLSFSVAAVRGEEIIGITLYRSKPAEPAIVLELVVTAPRYRNGPTPLILFAETARRGLAAGHTQCVFEADEQRDPFPIGFARRCGATATWHRYRYAISQEGMKAVLVRERQADLPT